MFFIRGAKGSREKSLVGAGGLVELGREEPKGTGRGQSGQQLQGRSSQATVVAWFFKTTHYRQEAALDWETSSLRTCV